MRGEERQSALKALNDIESEIFRRTIAAYERGDRST